MHYIYKFIVACLVFGAYIGIGFYQLSTIEEDINGKTGNIWVQLQSGFEKLQAVETQLKAAYKDRKDITEMITNARKDYAAASENLNLDNALTSATKAVQGLRIIVENYPSTELSTMQVGVLDETAGIFNRLAYARQQLINSQVSFNQTRILFYPIHQLFARKEVLGEKENPAAGGPKSSF